MVCERITRLAHVVSITNRDWYAQGCCTEFEHIKRSATTRCPPLIHTRCSPIAYNWTATTHQSDCGPPSLAAAGREIVLVSSYHLDTIGNPYLKDTVQKYSWTTAYSGTHRDRLGRSQVVSPCAATHNQHSLRPFSPQHAPNLCHTNT